MELDELSKDILQLLQSGKYCSPDISKIAKKLKKSPATILRRIRELERSGFVQEYVAHVDPIKLGRGITAFVRVQMNYPKNKKVTHEELVSEYIEYFKRLPEVQEIYIPLGTWDFLLKVKTKNIQDQYRFISEKLMPLGVIERMESLIMMKTFQERSYVDVED